MISELIEAYRAYPAATIVALILVLALLALSLVIGMAVLTWIFNFLAWVIPKVDAAVWRVLALFG
jgi:hypothetical protein